MLKLGTEEQYRDAPWMKVAESYLGVREVRGGENPVILKFFAEAGHPEIREDEVAWCSAFENAVFYESGMNGTKNLMAKSWLQWTGGKRVSEPRFGDVVVFTRGNPRLGLGHVAFFLEWDEDTVTVLGGNQGRLGEVSVSKMSRGSLVGFMRPNYQPVDTLFDRPSIPKMTDQEAPNFKPEQAGVVGSVAAAAAAAWGQYQIAIMVGAAALFTFFVVWYVRHRKVMADATAMEPQYKPASRVAASRKIAEFEPPVEPSELVIQHRPRKRKVTAKKKVAKKPVKKTTAKKAANAK